MWQDYWDNKGVIGAPDLVVEVLSGGIENYDINVKKQVYELIGVKEYWIVNTKSRYVEIYILKDGKYELLNMYYQNWEKNEELLTEFSPTLFPDLIIKIDDIFDDLIEE